MTAFCHGGAPQIRASERPPQAHALDPVSSGAATRISTAMPEVRARVQNAIDGPKDTPRGKEAQLLARCDVGPSRQAG